MDNLKPCPFCGCKAIIDQWPVSNKLYVRCPNSNCILNHGTGLKDGTLKKHIKIWNRRAKEDV